MLVLAFVLLNLAPTPGMANVASEQTQMAEIYEIQGAGLISPLENEIVVTDTNVVTAITALSPHTKFSPHTPWLLNSHKFRGG